MQFLNREIEALTKRKKTQSLAKKQQSCGIFQDIANIPIAEKSERKEGFDFTP